MDESKSLDILGIKPLASAIEKTADKTVEKSFEGIETFLRNVCLPALEEVGMMMREQVRYWRLKNVLRMLEKSQNKLEYEEGQLKIQAHPKVALSIIEHSSLNDNDDILELWAGLFASSCTKNEQDDENLIFVDLLKQLTVVEAKMLKYGCENSAKKVAKNMLVMASDLNVSVEKLMEIAGIHEIYRLDRELDHLRTLGLIHNGFIWNEFQVDDLLVAEIAPTALGLNLYIKCQGSHKSPAEFWELKPQENSSTP